MNRDTVAAVLLLAACGVLLVASFDIREPDYGQLSPATWPRTVLAALTLLTVIFLFQSLRRGSGTVSDEERKSENLAAGADDSARGSEGFFSYWRNVLWCFGLFFVYLLSLPWLGMLVGGTLFVFFLLNALGGWSSRLLGLHAIIAIVSVGGMWTLFTYGLGVLLPAFQLFE